MRVVLDTNVVISAILIRGGNEDRILQAWRRKAFELVLSTPILIELAQVLLYDKIRKAQWMSEKQVSLLLESFAKEAMISPGHSKVAICRDSADNKFLEAAVDGKAEYLATGDQDLLVLKTYHHIEIVKPSTFLKILS